MWIHVDFTHGLFIESFRELRVGANLEFLNRHYMIPVRRNKTKYKTRQRINTMILK